MSRKQRGRNEGSVFYDESRGRWVGCVSLPPARQQESHERALTA
jgi:hypothetical protein